MSKLALVAVLQLLLLAAAVLAAAKERRSRLRHQKLLLPTLVGKSLREERLKPAEEEDHLLGKDEELSPVGFVPPPDRVDRVRPGGGKGQGGRRVSGGKDADQSGGTVRRKKIL